MSSYLYLRGSRTQGLIPVSLCLGGGEEGRLTSTFHDSRDSKPTVNSSGFVLDRMELYLWFRL